VRDFRLTLEKHFHTTQSVSEYARLLKVSATYLGGAVHERTGREAGDIIRQRVLLEAKRLLAHTEMTVSEAILCSPRSMPGWRRSRGRWPWNLHPCG
jgi:AraC-like DNA-binding protein